MLLVLRVLFGFGGSAAARCRCCCWRAAGPPPPFSQCKKKLGVARHGDWKCAELRWNARR